MLGNFVLAPDVWQHFGLFRTLGVTFRASIAPCGRLCGEAAPAVSGEANHASESLLRNTGGMRLDEVICLRLFGV